MGHIFETSREILEDLLQYTDLYSREGNSKNTVKKLKHTHTQTMKS